MRMALRWQQSLRALEAFEAAMRMSSSKKEQVLIMLKIASASKSEVDVIWAAFSFPPRFVAKNLPISMGPLSGQVNSRASVFEKQIRCFSLKESL